jgi:hypothetical protein
MNSTVNLSFSGLPVDTAVKVFEKVLPGQVGLPLSTLKSKKTLTVNVSNKKLKNALEDAGFWTR